MLARRGRGIDLNDGHALLAALVSALARPTSAWRANLNSSSSTLAATSPRRPYSTAGSNAVSSEASAARRSAKQQPRGGSRRRFCDLQAAREHRATERQPAGYEGPVASTSAVTLDSPAPQRDPPAPPASVLRPNRPQPRLAPTTAPLLLLKTVRNAHVASPTSSPVDLVSAQRPILYDDDGDPQHPPTPPPPIAFLPEPNRPNPHLLSAFLLQAIFLGASALGLLTRRKVRNEGRPVQMEQEETLLERVVVQSAWAKQELERKRLEGDCAVDDVPALNLLLSSFAELDPALETQWRQEMPKQKRTALLNVWRKRRDAHLGRVSSLLARFKDGVRPDHWTVLAVLAIAQPAVALPLKSTHSAFAQAQPLLAQWAWRAFAELDETQRSISNVTYETRSVILSAFLVYLSSPSSAHLAAATREDMLSRIFDHFTSSPDSFSTFVPSTRLAIGLAALADRQTSIVVALLDPVEPLLPTEDVMKLATAALNAISMDEEWRKKREVVTYVAQAAVSATEELCRERAEGMQAQDVERAVRSLMEGMGVDVDVTPLVARLVTAPLRHSSTFFEPQFIRYVLHSLIDARQPALAMKIFHLLPLAERTHEQYYALLRSHHRPTTLAVWDELSARWLSGDITVEVKAFEAKLKGLLNSAGDYRDARVALSIARQDLALLRTFGIDRSRILSNTYLRLISKVAHEPAWRRAVGNSWREGEVAADVAENEQGREEENPHTRSKKEQRRCTAAVGSQVDDYTRAIILGRVLEGARGRDDAKTGRRQLDELRLALVKSDGMMQRRQGVIEKADGMEESPIDVRPNLILKCIARWRREFGTKAIVSLAEQTLKITLRGPSVAENGDPPSLPIPTKHQYEKVRRPAYRMLMKALRNRGERRYHDRLLRAMRDEEARMRSRAREKERQGVSRKGADVE